MRKEETEEVLFNRMINNKIHVNVRLFTPRVLYVLFEQNCRYLLWSYDENTKEDYDKIIYELNEFIRRHGLGNLFTKAIRQIAIENFMKDYGREYTYK